MATATVPLSPPPAVPVPDAGPKAIEFPVAAGVPAPTPAPAPASGSALLGTYRRAPMSFVRGAGMELYDATGRGWLDFTSGIGVMALGHDDHGVRQAMQQALDTGLVHVSNLFSTAPGEELAKALVQRSFADKVFFCNSGAEANEGAFKFARRWARLHGGANKNEIVALRGAFHGRLMGTLAATDRAHYRVPFRPLAGGISICERDMGELDARISAEATAAVIVEPVQGESGVRVLDTGFLRELRQLTLERNVALIVDEVQCGLGRTGTLFAYEHAGIQPDLMTLAKPLAGGLPMGAVLLTDAIASAIQPGDHGSTFGGGPFVAAVAVHVLNRVSDPALLGHVRETGAWLGSELRAIAARTGTIRAVRGRGFMWGMDVHFPAARLLEKARELGLLLLPAGEYTVRILPPLVASREELRRGLEILEAALVAASPPARLEVAP